MVRFTPLIVLALLAAPSVIVAQPGGGDGGADGGMGGGGADGGMGGGADNAGMGGDPTPEPDMTGGGQGPGADGGMGGNSTMMPTMDGSPTGDSSPSPAPMAADGSPSPAPMAADGSPSPAPMAFGGGMTMPVMGEPMAPLMDSPTISPSYSGTPSSSESPVMDNAGFMPPTGDREVGGDVPTSGVASRLCLAGALLAVVVALA